AIQWAFVQQVPNPIFFVDNKSVLLSFLNLDTHSSQLASIHINLLLKDYLSTTDNVVSFAHCPSHVGITGNERADRLTKEGAAIGPMLPLKILRSNFIGQFKRDMTKHWHILAKSQTYKGRSWLPIKRKRRDFKPDITNKSCRRFFTTLSGNDIDTTSRMACTLTNHAPMGEYRRRFHPDKPSFCKFCGPETEHTRSHALFLCPKYKSLAPSLADWRKDRNNDKTWKLFFQANPSALTFGNLPEDVH
ncbi:hypothetical protein AX14_010540, partial [Amanita brunnescens Koide BX004]